MNLKVIRKHSSIQKRSTEKAEKQLLLIFKDETLCREGAQHLRYREREREKSAFFFFQFGIKGFPKNEKKRKRKEIKKIKKIAEMRELLFLCLLLFSFQNTLQSQICQGNCIAIGMRLRACV